MHAELTDDAVTYAVKMGKVLVRNDKNFLETSHSTKNKSTANKYKCTNLVNRKSNYKECIICKRLIKNMSAHVQEKHKIKKTDGNYKDCVYHCPVVPGCFVKFTNGVAIKMSQTEMDAIKDENEKVLTEQFKTNKSLKQLNEQIRDITKKISSASDVDEIEILKSNLLKLKEEYALIRYKDLRQYPETLKTWKESYSSYTRNTTNSKNAEKIARAACDLILNYVQHHEDIQLNSEFLLDGKILNEMLILQKNREDLVTDTKLKYLAYYKSFLTFIINNPTSPENIGRECSDIMINNARLAQMNTVLSDHRSGLLNLNKTEKAEKVQKKKEKKIITSKEMEDLSDSIERDCRKIKEDYNNGLIKQYTQSDCRKARNALIAAATTRIPRRSKELLTMTMREAKAAKKTLIENMQFYLVYVLEHKTNTTGEPAIIVYSNLEYESLSIYINCIRSRFTNDTNLDSPVFLSFQSQGKTLSFSSATHILNSYRSDSGKSLSTRVARVSRTTEQRASNPTKEDISEFARSLSHSTDPSERYYVSEDLEQAVINFVRRQIVVSISL